MACGYFLSLGNQFAGPFFLEKMAQQIVGVLKNCKSRSNPTSFIPSLRSYIVMRQQISLQSQVYVDLLVFSDNNVPSSKYG